MHLDLMGSASKIGGKAYNLRRLSELCQVPAFFVIAFSNAKEIDDELNQEIIKNEFIKRNFEVVAVRSSANCEDEATASFAGMFHTVLGVKLPGLVEAIREVLSSAKSERVTAYEKMHNLSNLDIRMSVIIQKLVRSRVSGVCFSRSDSTPDFITIEACYGLGEALVSGKVTPDFYAIDRHTLNIQNKKIGYQSLQLELGSNAPEYRTVPFYLRASMKLSKSEIGIIARNALKIERELEFPAADIEWAIEDDDLYITQARPYTGFSTNDTLNLRVQDKGIDKEQKITSTASSDLSKEEVDRMQKDAEMRTAKEIQHRNEIEAKNIVDKPR